MTPTALFDRIAAGESQTQEFKTSFDKSSIESLVAFANTQGGTVLVGVSDGANVLGVTVGKETLNEWLGQIKSATSPSLTFAQKQQESESEGANAGVNVGVDRLLAYIQANPSHRASDMAGTFAVTQRTVKRWLKQLKADGQIEFRGAPKTGGYFPQNL